MEQKTIRVKIVSLGNLYFELNRENITKWKSALFEVEQKIDYYSLNDSPDTPDWGFSDKNLKKIIANLNNVDTSSDADITFYVLDAPIEDNYLVRNMGHNRIIVSYYQVKELLHLAKLPIKNYLLVIIYSYALLLMTKKQGDWVTDEDEEPFLHYDSTGCIYDFCANRADIIRLCESPHLCDNAEQTLKKLGVDRTVINRARKELKGIRRDWFNGVVLFVKTNKAISILLGILGTIVLNVISGIISNYLINP